MSALRAPAILLLLLAAASAQTGAVRGMELVSARGRQKSLKLYTGEAVSFQARESRAGLGGLLAPGLPLDGVRFRLREWPKPTSSGLGILDGTNRRVVWDRKPEPELWGLPPSSCVVRATHPPGRYRLEAEKKGYSRATVLVHIAHLHLMIGKAELSEKHYFVSFDLSLVDPDEKGRPIPVLLEIIDDEGRVVDRRDDVVLAPVNMKPGHYRSNRKIRLSSSEIEGFRERVDRREKDPLPAGFAETKSLRITAGSSLRLAFRNLHAVYPLPLGF